MPSSPLIAGIDIGGTLTRVALARAHDPVRILARCSQGTPRPGTKPVLDRIAEMVADCVQQLRVEADIHAVGCAAPGMTDSTSGVVLEAANLPGWVHVPLQEMLEGRLQAPARVGNDVNLAALAEATCGAGQGCDSIIFMTVSTGVAAGIVINSELIHGAHYCAGEIGNIIPEPTFLERDWRPSGCLESLAGGAGLAAQWQQMHDEKVSAEEIFAAAKQNLPEAQGLVGRAEQYLCQAAVALGSIIDPRRLVLGGSIGLNHTPLTFQIQAALNKALPFPPEVVPAALGADAPLIGALLMAKRLSTPELPQRYQ